MLILKGHYYFILFILYLEVHNTLTDKQPSLKLVQVLFRHGDRTPTETYKNDPYQYWREGWGQLTNIGKKQMYTMGLKLREKYKEFLSEYYFHLNVNVHSSYSDRCIMTAQTVLAGLFPPVNEQIWNSEILWQPIPVKYMPRDMDNMIALKRKCPVYDAALKNAYKTDRIQKIDEENRNLYEYLSKHTGDKIDNIEAVEMLFNTLEIEMFNNLSLPLWTKNISMEKLRVIAAQNLALYSDTLLMKRLTGGVLLNEIISNMIKKSNNTFKLDIKLFSGHDLTIVTLLRTLGFDELLKPDYGAAIIVELHQLKSNLYEVKLFYVANFSSEAESLNMIHCPTPCLLTNFIDVLQEVLPQNWENECKLV